MRTSSPADIPLSTVVKYGDYDFSAAPTNQPVPFVTMDQQMLNDHNGRWGRKDTISINGTITGDFDAITGAQMHIISGFSKDFQAFTITDTGIWAGHPVGGASGSLTDNQLVYQGKNCIVRNISFDEGRYHGLLGYSINLEAYQDGYAPTSGVLDPVNQYSFSEDQGEDTITITHNISARGIVSGNDPLTAAKTFVHNFTGYSGIDPKFITTGTDFCPVLKTQSETIDRPSATYSIVETYEAEATGCSECIVKYSCSIDSGIRDDFVRGSINGEVNCGKTGTLTGARAHFETLDLYDMLSADTSYSDFFEIPITFNSQETSGSKGNRKITFGATYDNNNILKSGSEDFVYASNLAYYEYNVGINYDEITEISTASIQGSVQSRGNLQEKIENVSKFINDELCTGDNGTGLLRNLTNDVYTGLTGSDFLNIADHPLNVYPNSLSVVSGKNDGSASISASYDNSDKIQTNEIRESSYNINVKDALPIFKPRSSVNEDGAYGIYKTNVYGREEVSINGGFVADHRSGVMTKNSTIENSGNILVNRLKTAFLTGKDKRIETENVNRAEANGSLNFAYAFSENASGIIPSGSTFKSSEE